MMFYISAVRKELKGHTPVLKNARDAATAAAGTGIVARQAKPFLASPTGTCNQKYLQKLNSGRTTQ